MYVCVRVWVWVWVWVCVYIYVLCTKLPKFAWLDSLIPSYDNNLISYEDIVSVFRGVSSFQDRFSV